ncbi:MAG: DUF3256 family protein [Prevotella sp.]|nr:DUF3256 family protein [Prevotella sp.]
MKHLTHISAMRWLCALVMAWGSVAMAPAQDVMRRTLMTIPDSIVPFLNHSMIGELVEFAGRGGTAEVKNKLDGMSSLDTLTQSYAAFTLTKVDKMQLMLLPRTAGDSIICLLHTYYGPEPESTVRFYSMGWQRLSDDEFLTPVTFDELVHRPDTMDADKFMALRKLFDPCLISVVADPRELTLTFSLSKPLLSEADKKALDPIVLQKTVKWSGKTF